MIGWKVIFLLLSIGLLYLFSELLIRGAKELGIKLGFSRFVIGVVILGFGTSSPELFVSTVASLKNFPQIALGNIVGSNIFNILLILGLTSLLKPIKINDQSFRYDFPVLLVVTILYATLIFFNFFERWIGFIALILFISYMWFLFKKSTYEVDDDMISKFPLLVNIVFVIGGLVGLYFSSDLLITSASFIARYAGIEEKVISLTVVAVGTSLPELAVSLVSIFKKEYDFAVGNIVGSNIFNALLIGGLSVVFSSKISTTFEWLDALVFFMSVVFLWLFGRTQFKISRAEGAILLSFGIAYTFYLYLS
ncbi:MAG: calcium/sodium antiporter [Bacteroidales bacterium]|nr:calcium/sodium antiporter [Bacteroidales bacterium]